MNQHSDHPTYQGRSLPRPEDDLADQIALTEETCAAVYATSGYEASVDTMSRVSLSSDNVFGDDGGSTQ